MQRLPNQIAEYAVRAIADIITNHENQQSVKVIFAMKVGEVGVILILTEEEYSILLGLLEDISQSEDVEDVFPVQYRMALKSIIQKLGGTYFGKL